ncbi:2-oxo acid dehydrogenase subunit E2 [Spongiibacter nanhainus]|uniref:Dihydrolipoyllysine-residue acetyltransferase component of pyruvate dehydrogenase complex n=1 Tax=Spongiibacter nanhainus TaxID=2794344 RepID=A0A7T4R3A1_9GAMM|nr:2-oxo acid dehydrogenase subunit E2 [Spongiibacter nanhainus]QQD19459.1 2-oxo acid dehydrogenase subunit E2 [Spongiibacter nanhainus]
MSNKTQQSMPWPEEDFSRYGEVEEKKLGNVQQYVGKVMHRNWTSIPHVTHNDDADITDFEQRRKAYNAANPDKKKTLLPVLMKASVAMLKEFPQFNVSLSADGATMFQKHYYHIGFAVDVPGGLLVPVVKDCDKKSVDDIAEEIVALSEKARGKGLPMNDMSGGCFTLSSLGHIGGTSFSPIINAPEVAIMGITRAASRFVPDAEGKPVLRQFLPLSLSYDHRVINGADAARFTRAMADWLQAYTF